ncbi:MAG: SulP family inorganic anion transporter [Flavobacteriaceae bacterium]
MQRYFPILEWIQGYNKSLFKSDFTAGVTVGIMLIPQGMAYAMIAGLPPVYGLYSAIFPQLVYALMGSSRQLAVGPVAMDSLLVATALNTMAIVNSDHYISLAIFLALFMGLIQIFLGLLKFGFLVNFLSKPVISGFTSAAAIIIGLSQLNHILGISLTSHNLIHQILAALWATLGNIHPFTALITMASILLIFSLKRLSRKIPAPLLVVIIATSLTASFQWNDLGVKIVGFIPRGLPSVQIQEVTAQEVYQLLPMALTLALIAFLEAISVAKAIEIKENKETVDPNQELIALGSANVLGSFFQAYSSTGGFSRTAVNHQSGAKTGMASLISALLVGLTLIFFTDLFYHLPKAVLGAVILSAVINLIDVKYPYQLWKTRRQEFFVLLFTFSLTLFLGVKEGILLGTLVSLTLMLYRSSQPHIAVLGRIKGTRLFRNVLRFPDQVETFPGVLIVRFDGQLFFGNHSYFKKQIAEKIENEKQKIKFLVIDAGPINYVDSTASATLHHWIQELDQKEIQVMWVKTIGPIRDIFRRDGMDKIIGKRNFFSSLDTAIGFINGEDISSIEKKVSNQSNLK